MLILLTTPFDPGSFDTHDYTHVKISSFSFDILEESAVVTAVLGYLNESQEFVCGVSLPGITNTTYTIKDEGEGTDYWELTHKTVGPTPSATIFDRLMEELYQYLLDKGYYVGTIE